MKYALPAIGAGIENQPIPIPSDPFLNGNLSRRDEQPHQQLFVHCLQLAKGRDVLDWYDQDVNRATGWMSRNATTSSSRYTANAPLWPLTIRQKAHPSLDMARCSGLRDP